MNATMFLAHLWGPVLLAIGLGVFVSRSYYVRVYRNLQKEALAVLLFGMIAIVWGILQVGAHNLWGTPAEVIISIIGWGMLAKGLLFAVAPGVVDRAGDKTADSGLIPMAGVLMLVIGAYLSWFAYLA